MTSTNCFKSVFHFQFLLIGLFLIAFSSCEEEDDKVEPASKPNTTAHEAIVLPCNFFETDSVLKNDSLKEVDYIIDCFMQINGDKKVRIEPGVVIEFKQDAGIRVNDNVAFIAEGTEEKPIVFSGTGKGKGYWRGLFFSSQANNSLAHVKVEYAAGKKFTENSPIYEGSIAVATSASLNLSHVEISNGGNLALGFSGGNSSISTSNLTISENEGVAVRVCAYNAHIFDSSSTFFGNAFDYINVIKDYYEIESTVSWKKLAVPYLIDDRVHITDNGFLTIEAGAELLFRENGYLQAAGNLPPYNYALNIMGTSAEPVKLSGYNQVNWGGIYYSFTQENNLIKHAIIEGAKGDIAVGNITNTGAIYMHADPKLTIEDTEFKDLPNCAYYAYTGASTNQPPMPNFSATNLTLTNVAGGEFCWGGKNGQ